MLGFSSKDLDVGCQDCHPGGKPEARYCHAKGVHPGFAAVHEYQFEGGAIIGPPTLVNAIHDALAPFGVTCLDLPLTPAKLLALIEKGKASA